MNRIITLIIAIFTVTISYGATVKITIKNYNQTSVHFIIDNQKYAVEISPEGVGELDVKLKKARFGIITVGKSKERVYLAPKSKLTIEMEMELIEAKDRNYTKLIVKDFTGNGREENLFMRKAKVYRFITIGNLTKDLKQDIAIYRKSYAENAEIIEKTPLSKEFKELEKQRLNYSINCQIMRLITKENCDEFLTLFRTNIVECPSLLHLDEYSDFLKSLITKLSYFEVGTGDDQLLQTNSKVAKIFENYKNPMIIEYLVDFYISPYIEFNGYNGAENLVAIYNERVKSPEKMANFKKACALYDSIAKGKPCPNFTFNDVNDKVVSLTDLRGKYVLIDMWATWCGPCMGEIPSLQELEKRYEGHNIYFVGISVDRNKDIKLWKKTVADKNMHGYQLHLGEQWDWLKHFMPYSLSVPRFILLDPEGNFIDANMSRPSDKATAKLLDSLLIN